MSINTPDEYTEQVYQNTQFSRTITAERTYTDRGLARSRSTSKTTSKT